MRCMMKDLIRMYNDGTDAEKEQILAEYGKPISGTNYKYWIRSDGKVTSFIVDGDPREIGCRNDGTFWLKWDGKKANMNKALLIIQAYDPEQAKIMQSNGYVARFKLGSKKTINDIYWKPAKSECLNSH